MTTQPKIAIIGLGKIGQALATDFSKSDRHFITAATDLSTVRETSKKWGALAEPLQVADAVKKADIVILAIPFGGVVPLLKENAAALEGKIIIDPSNPFKFENGDFKKIIGEKETAGEINAAATPKNAKFVKALGTLGAENLSAAAFRSPKKATLFYASDDTSVNQTIEQLIKELGFDPLRVGNIDQSIRIEIHGDLHQVTALPDPVSLEEAKKLL